MLRRDRVGMDKDTLFVNLPIPEFPAINTWDESTQLAFVCKIFGNPPNGNENEYTLNVCPVVVVK